MIKAIDILQHEGDVVKIRCRYRTVWDSSLSGLTWDNLEKALNILAEHGWWPVSAAISEEKAGRQIYVIVEKSNVSEKKDK